MEKVFAVFEKKESEGYDGLSDYVILRQIGLYHETIEEAEKEIEKSFEWLNNPYPMIILPVYIKKK